MCSSSLIAYSCLSWPLKTVGSSSLGTRKVDHGEEKGVGMSVPYNSVSEFTLSHSTEVYHTVCVVYQESVHQVMETRISRRNLVSNHRFRWVIPRDTHY